MKWLRYGESWRTRESWVERGVGKDGAIVGDWKGVGCGERSQNGRTKIIFNCNTIVLRATYSLFFILVSLRTQSFHCSMLSLVYCYVELRHELVWLPHKLTILKVYVCVCLSVCLFICLMRTSIGSDRPI